ncbi:MAG: glycosyl transferase family A [Acidobacteria bacterium]|nr:MAG: glycosyl transferase family A [Acidobacteriota bacterium]
MKTISVIIPTYNYARYLREAIDSALAQTYAPLEVIVIDDGSTDETPLVLAEYGNRIRTIRQNNAGVGAARTSGIAAARGEYIALLDSDDIWLPRKLELQIARFEADPSLGLVHCGSEAFDDAGPTLSMSLDGMEGRVADEMLRFEREVLPANGSSILFPTRIAEEVGGFDARLPPSDDWDFCYRVAVRHPIGYVREVLVRYRQHGSGLHLNIAKMENAMLISLAKAFESRNVPSLRRQAYGRLHRVLAGCYFQAHQPLPFVRHMMKSLRYDVRNFAYFAAYPWRLLSRARRRRATPAA